ncbi:MAG TPA: PAS domain S-box protein [Roseomonas sp.]|nr:PAS domain S-box protein [Roseomonas sp.]
MKDFRHDLPFTEAERLAAVARSGLLDTPPEQAFDELAQLTAELFDAPMAAIHLIAKDRQWAKAEVGLGRREMPREISFCAHTLNEPDGMVVPDASRDPRFAANPLVTGKPGIRFYAGEPLELEGLPIGALCVLDTRPRQGGLSQEQRMVLRRLASQANSQIALRHALAQRDAQLDARERAEALRHRLLESASEYAIVSTGLDGRVTGWNAGAEHVFGWRKVEMLGRNLRHIFGDEDAAAEDRAAAEMRQAAVEGWSPDTGWHLRSDHSRFWASGGMTPLRDAQGSHIGYVKVLRDETQQHAAAEQRRIATAEFSALVAAQQAVTRGPGSELMIWRAVVSAAMGVVGTAESACVETPDGNDLVYRVVHGACTAGTRVPRQGSLSGLCLEEGRMLLSNDTQADPRLDAALYRKFGLRSVITVPVPRRDSFVAVLKLASSRRGAFTEEDAALAELLVGIISSGLSLLAEERSLQALQSSETRLRLMADAVPQIVWQADAEGQLDFLNRRWAEFTGVPVEEGLSGRRMLELLHPDDVEPTLAAWREARTAGRPFRINHRLRAAGGSYRWLLTIALPYRDPESGTILRWFGGSTDVDAEYRAQETIRRLKDTLERRVAERTEERDRIWQLSRDMLGVSSASGVFVSVNPAWTRTLGWSAAELVGRSPEWLVHPEDLEATRAELARLAAGETTAHFENRLRTKSGEYRWLSWSTAPAGGMLYAVARDVTEEKNQALALAQAEEQLRQSQKMEAVGQLTGGLAHDFNNLLAGIIAGLEMLQGRVAQGRYKELDRYIGLARSAADRAAALTHRLLAFSRRQTLDPRPTDLNQLVAGMEELIRRTVTPAIQLEVAAAPDLWLTLCDRNQVENALLNLCINARDAMPDGGRLILGTENADFSSGRRPVRDLPPGQYVALWVTDTGTGMAPEVIAHAFDPFYTTKPSGQGTGLGLSMVYGFARQSGGQVHIASELGRGTSVTIYLPRHVGPAEGETSTENAAPAATGQARGTIMVVDDEPAIRVLMAEALRELGYTVIEAQDTSGLRILERGRRVDLLLTDVGLPGGMNGRQLADAARARHPDLKVLFITGYAEKAAVGDRLEPGMEVMSKPFTMQALGAKVRAMLGEEAA